MGQLEFSTDTIVYLPSMNDPSWPIISPYYFSNLSQYSFSTQNIFIYINTASFPYDVVPQYVFQWEMDMIGSSVLVIINSSVTDNPNPNCSITQQVLNKES